MPNFRPNFLLFFLSTMGAVFPIFANAEINQAEALAAAAAINRTGSDESLQNSTTSAMKAMLELDKQNRPGAMQNGYKSFGEYRTSEDLDVVRMKNRIRQIDMFTNNLSIRTAVPAWASRKEIFTTTYGRLDPKFLRQGEAGKVADEFERKSGMKREDFLKRITKASESAITADDPNLTAKIMDRFASFVEDIPNEEFRSNVQKQIESVTAKSKASLIRDGVERVFEILASQNINVSSKVALMEPNMAAEQVREPASNQESSGSFVAVPVVPGKHFRQEDPLQHSKNSFLQEMAPRDADFRGLGREKFSGDALGSVMQTALDEQDGSIFKQISRRYRAVTPALSLVKEQTQ